MKKATRSNDVRNKAVILNKIINKRITQLQGAAELGVSDRQVRNLLKAYKEHGESGLIHGLTGKGSNNKLDEELENKVKDLLKLDIFQGCTPIFIKEKLEEDFGIVLSKETIRKIMINEGIREKRERKGKYEYRQKRARKLYYGEMSQFDGSYHQRVKWKDDVWCLLLDIDDATGRIMHAKFGKNEGHEDVFTFRKERAIKHGVPRILYTDNFATYKKDKSPYAEKPGNLMPQFRRIMSHLGTEIVVTKKGPQGKGRIERGNRTMQDRFIQELQYHKIYDIDEANKFLVEEFIPRFNKKYSIKANMPGNVHIQLTDDQIKNIDWIFSYVKDRKLQNDYTIQFKNNLYQLYKSSDYNIVPGDYIFVATQVNGTVGIFKDCYCEIPIKFKLLDEKEANKKKKDRAAYYHKIYLEKKRIEVNKMKEAEKKRKEERFKTSKERQFHFKAVNLLKKKEELNRKKPHSNGLIDDVTNTIPPIGDTF